MSVLPSRWTSFWRRSFDIRPHERKRAWLGFFTLYGLVVTHELLETSRNAMFLQRLSSSSLPYAYLALALGAVVWSVVARSLSERWRPRLSTTLMLSTVGIGALWLSQGSTSVAYPYALYLSTSLVVPVWMVGFWIHQSSVWTIVEAKRIFAFFALGGLLGNVSGAGLAGALGDRYGVPALILTAGAVIVATTIFAARPMEKLAAPAPRQEVEDVGTAPEDVPRRYVPTLFAVAVLAAIATKLGEFLFLHGVSIRVGSEHVASTLAAASLISSMGAIVVQLLFSGWALRSLGVTRSAAILPALYSIVAFWSAAGSAYHAPMMLRVTDGALRQPVYRTAIELLFVPLPPRTRNATKTWIDIAGQRAGQALASLAILLFASGAHEHARWLALATAVVAVLWALCTPLLQRDYVELFRLSLGRGPARDDAAPSELEQSSVIALLAWLHRGDEGTVVTSIDLLVEAGASSLLPATLLAHPSRAVILKALEAAPPGARSWARSAQKLLRHEDSEVRAAALRYLAAPAIAKGLLDDPDPRVRATAFVILFAQGRDGLPDAELEAFAARDRETQIALISTIGAGGSAPSALEHVLEKLAQSADPAVRESVARLAERHPMPSLLPALIDMVAHASTRAVADDAIAAFGPRALDALGAKLEDESTPRGLRHHLPQTIARIGGPAAARMLLRRYPRESDERTRTKLLRALLGLTVRDPSIHLDRAAIAVCIESTLTVGGQLGRFAGALATFLDGVAAFRTATSTRLFAVLHEERGRALERALLLLELLHRGTDYAVVRRALVHGDGSQRAHAVELLGNVAPTELKGRLIALCSDDVRLAPEPERPAPAAQELRAYHALLMELEATGGDVVRVLAVEARRESTPFAARTDDEGPLSEKTLTSTETVLWLRKIPLLEHVDPRGLALLAARTDEAIYLPGAAIGARNGDPAIAVVVSGTLETASRELVGAGAVLGEDHLFSEAPSPFVIAETEVRVLELRRTALLEPLGDHFDLFLAVLRKLAERACDGRGVDRPEPPNALLASGSIVERMEAIEIALPFAAAKPSFCAQLAAASTSRAWTEGEPILSAGAPCRSIAILTHGEGTAADAPVPPFTAIGFFEALAQRATPELRAHGPASGLVLDLEDLLDALEDHAAIQPLVLALAARRTGRVPPPLHAPHDLAAE